MSWPAKLDVVSNPLTGENALLAPLGGFARLPDTHFRYFPNLNEVPVNTNGVTVTLGPTTDANTASEYATMAAAYPKAYSFANADLVNANKYLYFPGSTPVNTSGMSVSNRGRAWPVDVSKFWKDGKIEVQIDAAEFVIVQKINSGAYPVGLLIDGESPTPDQLTHVGTSGNKDRWITVVQSTRGSRRVTIPFNNVSEIRLKQTYDSISKPPKRRRMAIYGDSFAARVANNVAPETTVPFKALGLNDIAARVSRILGLATPFFSCTGGTGFVNETSAGQANNYLQRMTIESGSDDVSVVWLWGSGNDYSNITLLRDQINATIDLAKVKYPNAIVVVTSVYGGFNTPVIESELNAIYASVAATRKDFVFIPIGASLTNDDGMLFGTGSFQAPSGSGNADLYLGGTGMGADRHWNALGIQASAPYLAQRFVTAFSSN